MLVVLFKTIILAAKSIKNGFTISIGWNIGRKIKSIHLFDPFISTPINGTKKSKKIEIAKKSGKYFIIWSLFWIEMIINKNKLL